jgi:hypothetical protein
MIVLRELCDRCGAELPTRPNVYGNVEARAAGCVVDLRYAANGWGRGPDDPHIQFRGKLCAECFGRLKEAVGAFLAVWLDGERLEELT